MTGAAAATGRIAETTSGAIRGKKFPPTDLPDPSFRRYQHWADRRMEDLVRRMKTQLKRIEPEVALVTWTTNAGR